MKLTISYALASSAVCTDQGRRAHGPTIPAAAWVIRPAVRHIDACPHHGSRLAISFCLAAALLENVCPNKLYALPRCFTPVDQVGDQLCAGPVHQAVAA